MKVNTRGKIIVLVLSLAIILPAVFYSVYEITTLNETEKMISEVYTRQLDVVLFSVNQHIIDVAASWATRIESNPVPASMKIFLENTPAIDRIVTSDSSFRGIRKYALRGETAADTVNYRGLFKLHKPVIDRLFRYREVSYQKLEPVIFGEEQRIGLLFVSGANNRLVMMVLREGVFLESIIAKKLHQVAGSDFIIAIEDSANHSVLYSTSPIRPSQIARRKPLWIFPNYYLGIRLAGTTIQELAQDRFSQNLTLIILFDLLMIAFGWIIFRNYRREMQLVALKSDFVSNVSHELRTPLSLIRMFAETLEMKRVPTEKKKQEYYKIILNEAERLTRLINNILNFSQMERGVRQYHFKPVDLNEILSSVLSLYAYQFEAKKFSVAVNTAPRLPVIQGDGEALAEAIHNLIDNAIKYSSTEHLIKIETAAQTDTVTISVEDHGIGIAQEHRKKIFETFYRVSQGLVTTAKGSGLGLSLVKHIIEAHHGRIEVQSELGRGSTFTIHLPIKP